MGQPQPLTPFIVLLDSGRWYAMSAKDPISAIFGAIDEDPEISLEQPYLPIEVQIFNFSTGKMTYFQSFVGFRERKLPALKIAKSRMVCAIKQQPAASTRWYADYLGWTCDGIDRILELLRADGVIKREGEYPNEEWVVL